MKNKAVKIGIIATIAPHIFCCGIPMLLAIIGLIAPDSLGLGQLGDALGLQLGGLPLGFTQGLPQLFHRGLYYPRGLGAGTPQLGLELGTQGALVTSFLPQDGIGDLGPQCGGQRGRVGGRLGLSAEQDHQKSDRAKDSDENENGQYFYRFHMMKSSYVILSMIYYIGINADCQEGIGAAAAQPQGSKNGRTFFPNPLDKLETM